MKKLQSKTKQEWIAQAKKNGKQYLFFQGFCLDLTPFKNTHPGGSQVIKNYLFKDVTDILFSVFPHNRQTAPKILEPYRIGQLKQPVQQRVRTNGTILKRKDERQNSLLKKSVKFPTQVRQLASQKERKQQLQRLEKSRSQNKSKHGLSKNGSYIQQKISKKTKNINPDYINTLRGSKIDSKSKQFAQKQNRELSQNEVESKIKKIESIRNLNQSTANVSIKNYIQTSWGSFTDFIEQSIPEIKVPVLTIKLKGIW